MRENNNHTARSHPFRMMSALGDWIEAKMMLNKETNVNVVMFYKCIEIFVEVSQIEINYWFINILSNHDIKCAHENNGMKEFVSVCWKDNA